MTADLDHHDETAIPADEWVDAELAEFWRKVRAMSSATHRPTSVRANDLYREQYGTRPLTPEQRLKARTATDAMNVKNAEKRRERRWRGIV